MNTNIIDIWGQKHKKKKKKKKSINGNGNRSITIIHWNLGSKLWPKKTDEIRHLLVDYKPEICIISEANLHMEVPLEQRTIEGYTEILPLTMNTRKVARMLVLIKDGTNIDVKSKWMEDDTCSIWLELQRPGRRKLIIGAVYREQSLTRVPPLMKLPPHNYKLPGGRNF